ncbi:MAG: hypothetical protein KAW45_08275 [Thermoplasmatales archaeon]|nr:hypothetical protein [Thermoplasmatales archaeon]
MKAIVVIIVFLLLGVIFAQITSANLKKNEYDGNDIIVKDKQPVLNDIQKRFMLHNLRIRSYYIHVPPSYDGNTEVPLVILLHGGGSRGDIISIKTEMNEKADEEGFIAIYPNGAQGFLFPILNRLIYGRWILRNWNAGYIGGVSYLFKVDDVGFINSIIERMQKLYNINSSRIYVTGFSLGAIMTYYVGAKLSNKIAAIAPHSGSIGINKYKFLPSWIIPKPENPLPVIIFHGLKDENVPYEGGDSEGSVISVNESVEFWVNHNNCSNLTVNVSENENVTTRKYTNGTDGAEVFLYTVNNGEHWWFGGTWIDENNCDPYQEISATDLMWEFFVRHPKNK